LDTKRNTHPDLAIFDNPDKNKPDKSVGWFAVPYFFAKDFMRIGKGIPPSFWKFTFILWRELLQPTPVKNGKGGTHFEWPYTCNTTVEWFMEEFGLDTESVQDWSNAYSVSGLFSMRKGARKVKDLPGTPTHWIYNKKATRKDWEAFIIALARIVDPADGKRMARHGKVWTDEEKGLLKKFQYELGMSKADAEAKVREQFPGAGWPASDAFKLALALMVDHQRVHGSGQPGLPPVNGHKIQKWVEQGKAEARQEDGAITYVYKRPRAVPAREPKEWS
jgi:hypothetical protein